MIEKWTYDCGHKIQGSSPVIGKDGIIYIISAYYVYPANEDIWVDAINPDGTRKWQTYLTEGEGRGMSVFLHIDEDYVYVAPAANSSSGDKKYMYALNKGDGSIHKVYTGIRMNGYREFIINKSNEVVYLHGGIGDDTNYLICIDLSTGNEVWRYKVYTAGNSGPPTLDSDENINILSDREGGAYAITKDGALIFNTFWNYWDFYSPAAMDKEYTLFVNDLDDYLYSVNRDGSINWRAFLYTGFSCAAFPIGNRVYIAGYKYNDGAIPSLFCLDKDTGETLWDYQIGVYPPTVIEAATPNITKDGTIYIATDKLYAINPDGTLKDSYTLPATGCYSIAPAIAQDGTIYVATYSNFLVALEGDSPPLYHRGDYYWS